MPISIRPLQTGDIPTLAAWIDTTPLMQRYGYDAQRAAAQLQQAAGQDDVLLVADAPEQTPKQTAGHACGLAWCLPRGAFGRGPYLKLLVVHPAATGHGIGARLLEAAEAAFAGQASHLFLLVSDFNHGAQRFYQRHGYHQVGTLPGYAVPAIDELIFWKRLSSP